MEAAVRTVRGRVTDEEKTVQLAETSALKETETA